MSFEGSKPRINLEQQGYDSYKAYLVGKADLTDVPTVYLNRWKGRSNQYLEYPSPEVSDLTPNTHMPPFDNVHCRLAVAYAIDRKTIADNVLGGRVHATYAIVPRGMLGYYSGKDNPHYSPVKARAELAQCPSRTTPFELQYPAGPRFDNELSAIGSMLSAVGMNVRLKPIPDTEWATVVQESLDKTNTQLVHSGWIQDYPDPQNYCTNLLRSGLPNNVGGWHDASYDRLVDRADATLNPTKRAKLYIQAQHIALSQGAFISLNNAVNVRLIKPYVHGLVGSEAFLWVVPKDGDWANVSVSPH